MLCLRNKENTIVHKQRKFYFKGTRRMPFQSNEENNIFGELRKYYNDLTKEILCRGTKEMLH